jgi:hypothetical protein
VKCYHLLVDVEYYALYKKKSIAMDENHSTIVRPRDGGLTQDERMRSYLILQGGRSKLVGQRLFGGFDNPAYFSAVPVLV